MSYKGVDSLKMPHCEQTTWYEIYINEQSILIWFFKNIEWVIPS
jgi:hypothetical protein